MSSSTSSSDRRRFRPLTGGLAFLAGVLVAWAAVWGVDRTGFWDRVGIDPSAGHAEGRAEPADVPIFYQRPSVPSGVYFFRRPGPAVETGRVLMQSPGASLAPVRAYAEAPPVRVSYGRYGFRDELPARPGGVAILGSSYVEAGFADAGDTIPGWLQRDHGWPASNWGMSFTGVYAARSTLERFVLPTRPAMVVWVFAERADFDMAIREHDRIAHVPGPVLPGLFRFVAETWRVWTAGAFARVRAIWSPATTSSHEPAPVRDGARFVAPGSRIFEIGRRRVRMQLSRVPAPAAVREALPLLRDELASMARAARAHGAGFAVAFLPVRTRLLAGHETSRPRLPALPDHAARLGAVCRSLDIPFVDTTPDLRRVLDAGTQVLNPLWDMHLNAEGMRTVARAIALRLPRGDAAGPGSVP